MCCYYYILIVMLLLAMTHSLISINIICNNISHTCIPAKNFFSLLIHCSLLTISASGNGDEGGYLQQLVHLVLDPQKRQVLFFIFSLIMV